MKQRRHRVLAASAIALLVFAAATYAGFEAYRTLPQGVLFYTPRGRCPNYSHPFTVSVTFWFLVAAFAALLVAGVARIATRRHDGPVQSTALWTLPFLALLWCTHPVFEHLLPLQRDAACGKPTP